MLVGFQREMQKPLSLTLGGCSLVAPGGIAKGKLRPRRRPQSCQGSSTRCGWWAIPSAGGLGFLSLPRFLLFSSFLFVSFFLLLFSVLLFLVLVVFPVFLFLPRVFAQVPRLLARTKITGRPGVTEKLSSGVLFRTLVTLRSWWPSWGKKSIKQRLGLFEPIHSGTEDTGSSTPCSGDRFLFGCRHPSFEEKRKSQEATPAA